MRNRFKLLLTLILCLGLLAFGAGRHTARLHEHSLLTQLAGLTEASADQHQYTCGMHPFIIQDEPGNCPICGMELTPVKSETTGPSASTAGAKDRKIKYWVAPMDPTYIRDEPGKSPMGMDLVPVYEDEAPGGSIITIDSATSQNMGIRTTDIRRRDISRTIRTVGLVGYDEPKQYSINSKISGWIERLHVNETGQQVKKGEPLLDIYSPELVSAQEELLLALRNRAALSQSSFPEIAEGAHRLLESSRNRLKLWDVSDEQIAKLEKTETVQRTLTLHAPYSGIVTGKKINEGQYVKAGMELFQISDLSRVWVFADIYEYELPWVKEGQEAEITLPFAGAQKLKGTVTYLYPYVEPKTRTVKARLEFDNRSLDLRPDMFVNVRIKSQTKHNVLTIPGEALLHSGEQQTVFVALGDGKYEPRQVKSGLTTEDGWVEIIQGLLDNETVVTSAQFMLDSESKLREAIRKMLEARQPRPKATQPAEQDDKREESLDDLFKDDTQNDNLEELFK